MNELRFKRDTEFRKQFFVPNSFAHPAKMDAQLLIWLVEHYSEPGQTILDPMFGSGTLMLACTLGRHVIGVELEQKFVDMAKQNWEKVKQRPQLGCAMGDCQILLGDARNLPQVLCDAVITSPPYEGIEARDRSKETSFQRELSGKYPKRGDLNISSGYQADVVISSPPYAEVANASKNTGSNLTEAERKALAGKRTGEIEEGMRYSKDPDNIGNLPYGRIDAILTSPPYEGSISPHDVGPIRGTGSVTRRDDRRQGYVQIDAVITSPPYEGSISDGREKILSIDGTKSPDWHPGPYSQVNQPQHYGHNGNIGNLKASSYLQAMLTVYQNCYAVLRDGGLMVLVVKNFIRNKAEVDLRADTVKLAEQAGFTFLEEYYRKLTQQSFWRILYARKYPDGPVIDKEYVLAFRKEAR